MKKKKKIKGRSGKGKTLALSLKKKDWNAMEAVKDTGTTLLVGVVGGGLIGAAMGKPAFYSGLGVSLVGGFFKVPLVSTLGMGMMASGGYQMTLNGFNAGGLNGVKERVQGFAENFKQRLYLDKIIKSKDEQPAVEGVGNVQYFRYPLSGNLDFGPLEKIERDLAESGRQFQQSQLRGLYEPSGIEDKIF